MNRLSLFLSLIVSTSLLNGTRALADSHSLVIKGVLQTPRGAEFAQYRVQCASRILDLSTVGTFGTKGEFAVTFESAGPSNTYGCFLFVPPKTHVPFRFVGSLATSDQLIVVDPATTVLDLGVVSVDLIEGIVTIETNQVVQH